MTSSSTAGVGLDFNQLLRESRHLESAMEGVSSAFSARSGGIGSGAIAGFGASGTTALTSALRLPTLQRNLAQLSVASKRLARQQVPTDTNTDSQAQLLLSAKGIDLRKQQRALKEIELSLPAIIHSRLPTAASATATGIESFHPLDIERFLQHQQQLLCHQAMEEAAKVTSDTYRLHDLSSLSDDWELAKRDILDSLGFRGGKNVLESTIGASATPTAATAGEKRKFGPGHEAALQAGPTGPVLAMEQAIYARTIQELNRARARRQPTNLLGSMKVASNQVDEYFRGVLTPGDVQDCWDVLQSMLLQSADPSDEYKLDTLTEKVFASSWSSTAATDDHQYLVDQLITGAKSYTQHLFTSYMRHVVEKYPDARVNRSANGFGTGGGGGKSGTSGMATQISTYVAILSSTLPPVTKDVTLDGQPFWPQVYYAFRSGHIDVALDYLHRHAASAPSITATGNTSFINTSANIGGGLNATQAYKSLIEVMEKRSMALKSIHSSLWLSLHEEYQRELSNAVNSARAHGTSSAHAMAYCDPFKLALYHLLGRFKLPSSFDLTQHVCPTTEDYLWMKLTLLDTSVGSSSATATIPESLRDQIDTAAMRLEALQHDLLLRGENAFNPDGRHPLAYFKVLLLSQQFEQAIYYLIRTPFFSIGVHFGIVLEYYGLLRSHQQSGAELLIQLPSTSSSATTAPRFAVNYARILRKYVEVFVRTHPFEAFHYLYLLHPLRTGGSVGRLGVGTARRLVGGMNASFLDENMPLDDHEDTTLPSQEDLANDPSFAAMRDLLLETKEYDLLVGTIGAATHGASNLNGPVAQVVQRGLIYTYYTRGEATYLLTHTAATMEQHGLVLDAVRLYVLASRTDLAVELLLKSLSPLVSSSLSSPDRVNLVELSQLVQRVLRSSSSSASSNVGLPSESLQHALHQLLRLVNYFDLYHLGPTQYDAALVLLDSPDVNLIPFSPDDVTEKAARFDNASATHVAVQRTISEVAISLMDIYYVQFQMLKREMSQQHLYGSMGTTMQRDQSKQQRLSALRTQARSLLSFLGRIDSSMQLDKDVIGKLVAIEALMAAA